MGTEVVSDHGIGVVWCLCSNIVGYVQQMDTFIGTVTIREALMFSANLRLPASTTAIQRRRLVEETISVLRLDAVADVLIGNEDYAGISPSQRKLLTIGLELVANPSILFVDEPTTGLDSKAAMTVCRGAPEQSTAPALT